MTDLESSVFICSFICECSKADVIERDLCMVLERALFLLELIRQMYSSLLSIWLYCYLKNPRDSQRKNSLSLAGATSVPPALGRSWVQVRRNAVPTNNPSNFLLVWETLDLIVELINTPHYIRSSWKCKAQIIEHLKKRL